MDTACFESPDWYRALYLVERIGARSAQAHINIDVGLDAPRADRELQTWRTQSPFDTGDLFVQRLALDEITEEDLRELLGEPAEAIKNLFPIPPDWLAELSRAFACSESAAASSASGTQSPPPTQTWTGFLDAIEPLIQRGRLRVREGIRALASEYAALPFDPDSAEPALFANLPAVLLRLMSRTLVLEMHVARLRGLLQGDTPEERFVSFIAYLRRREVTIALLQEYPVLARQLVSAIDRWAAFSLEFLRHLCADWDAIQTHFCPGGLPGPLVEVNGGMGDTHQGGHAVLIATFQSGWQVVYKPRSLAVDAHFQDLLRWLNNNGAEPGFRILKLLDRGDYGWVEFVAAQGCASELEVRRFYERQGGYLALLYVLEATDFHFENLIAAGEHPVLIDLEALFHPRIRDPQIPEPDVRLANKALFDSVLRIGLLPLRVDSDNAERALDVSGLGAPAGQLTPDPVVQWERANTDEMRVTRSKVAMPGGSNRPTLKGSELHVQNYADEIAAGFERIYRLLQLRRADLLASDGSIARCAQDAVRVIVRNTRAYALLLFEGYHPDLQRDALALDRYLDHLWAGAEDNPYLARAIAAEKNDLLQGDIPLFTTHPDTRDIWTSAGERIPDFCSQSGMERVRSRLANLSEEDCRRQIWFIRASLATYSLQPDLVRWPHYGAFTPGRHDDMETLRAPLLAAACRVADRLEWLALRDEEAITWIGLTLNREQDWLLVPLSVDLYDGLPGISLFLAYLGAVTGQERYIGLARATAATLQRRVQSLESSVRSVGAFGGLGASIYAFSHLGAVWNDPQLIAQAEALTALLPERIAQDEDLDIISGSAGCILSLLSLYRCAPQASTLELAVQCGERLLEKAQAAGPGIGWLTRIPAAQPLSGLSHGAAGIAWALIELAAVTGEKRFEEAGLAAIDYEHSLFSPEEGNWLDARDPSTLARPRTGGSKALIIAWCYGAAGIGLARLRCLRHVDRPLLREEAHAALQTTLDQGFGYNHCLCHGDLGNLELLLQAREILNEPQWKAHIERLSAMILESIERDGFLCGTPQGVESPGLMNGLTGIGYGLLRAAVPPRVPSLLTLAPPRAQS